MNLPTDIEMLRDLKQKLAQAQANEHNACFGPGWPYGYPSGPFTDAVIYYRSKIKEIEDARTHT